MKTTKLTIVCKVVPQDSSIPSSGGGDIEVGGHEVPHMSHPTLDSKGGSTFPQWQNWRSLAAQNIRQRQQLPYQDQPESSKHETFFSTGFDAARNADVPIILTTKAERISRKMVRRERVVVTSKNVVCKVVCALVVFLAVARCQVAVGGSYLSMLAGKRKQQMIFFEQKAIFSLQDRHI